MIEIDRSKCKKMLVWDNDENAANVELVCAHIKGLDYPYQVIDGSDLTCYKHAKPLPEPKEMTALDVMWWAGVRKVTKLHDVVHDMYSALAFGNVNKPHQWRWNELIRENGETKLKHTEWKEFNFENCDMED